MTGELFDAEPFRAPVADVAASSTTGARTLVQRQAAKLARRRHPLSGVAAAPDPLRLHPDAAPVDDRTAPGFRCGTCVHRYSLRHYSGNKSYPKCTYQWEPEDGTPPRPPYAPRVSLSEASDVRAWWPACIDHETEGDETP